MRQVAIQVQDIGSFLSWQSYVDDPGRELGVAQLVMSPSPLRSIRFRIQNCRRGMSHLPKPTRR